MSTKKTAGEKSDKKPGRPRKISSIPRENFKGILSDQNQLNDPSLNIQFTYSCPIFFHRYMNTFNTCGVEEVFVCFGKTKFSIKGKVIQNNTSVDMAKKKIDSTLLNLDINPNEIFSYFCDFFFKVVSF